MRRSGAFHRSANELISNGVPKRRSFKLIKASFIDRQLVQSRKYQGVLLHELIHYFYNRDSAVIFIPISNQFQGSPTRCRRRARFHEVAYVRCFDKAVVIDDNLEVGVLSTTADAPLHGLFRRVVP